MIDINTEKKYKQRLTLPRKGALSLNQYDNNIIMVDKGRVRVEDKDDLVYETYFEGESFMTIGNAVGAKLVALDNSTLSIIPVASIKSDMEGLSSKWKIIFINLIEQLTNKHYRSNMLGSRSMERKIVLFLKDINRRWHSKKVSNRDLSENTSSHIPFNKQQIAEEIGVSKQSLANNKVLKKLEKTGYIEIKNRLSIAILDEDRLDRIDVETLHNTDLNDLKK
ncbi:MAG: helix-turn-helix domain-containing protein [Candidatus Sedimenticola sp. (ex Thyasira tokunagai)]